MVEGAVVGAEVDSLTMEGAGKAFVEGVGAGVWVPLSIVEVVTPDPALINSSDGVYRRSRALMIVTCPLPRVVLSHNPTFQCNIPF